MSQPTVLSQAEADAATFSQMEFDQQVMLMREFRHHLFCLAMYNFDPRHKEAVRAKIAAES